MSNLVDGQTGLNYLPEYEREINFLDNLRKQRDELDGISSKWLQYQSEKARLELSVYDARKKLREERRKLDQLNEKLSEIQEIEKELDLTKEKLDQACIRVEDQVITLSSRIRRVQRQLLESYKNDVNALFIDIDQMVSNQVKPILEKIGAPPSSLARTCPICAREEGRVDTEDQFEFWTAMIPCGHQFCHSCADLANERRKCHLCNRLPDGILTLY